MSDYNPDPRRPENRYTNYDYTGETRNRSGFALVALLAIVALVGGFLVFARPQPADQQAQAPDRTMTTPNTNLPNAQPGTLAVPPKPPAATPANPQQ
jgi:hypothetical protein